MKAARWRANTFDYSRQDACAPKRRAHNQDFIVGKFREFVGVRTYLADRFLLQFHAKLVGLIKDRSRLALKPCFLVQSHQ